MYKSRHCSSPESAYELFATFVEKKDREHLVVVGLTSKAEPTMIHVAHIGSLYQYERCLDHYFYTNSVPCIACHNHSSDYVEPSKTDIAFIKN